MSKKSIVKMNISHWYKILPILLFAFSVSWVSGCGTGADGGECPDTSFSQTNLDTLEAKNSKFIWRICNADDEYAMEKIETFSNKVDFREIKTCTCSKYTSSENSLHGVDYVIDGKRFYPVYLDLHKASRGLVDSTEIRHSPGRYTYFFIYNYSDGDSSNSGNYRIEIKREAYHE